MMMKYKEGMDESCREIVSKMTELNKIKDTIVFKIQEYKSLKERELEEYKMRVDLGNDSDD